jgi:hypothetical protein
VRAASPPANSHHTIPTVATHTAATRVPSPMESCPLPPPPSQCRCYTLPALGCPTAQPTGDAQLRHSRSGLLRSGGSKLDVVALAWGKKGRAPRWSLLVPQVKESIPPCSCYLSSLA